MKALIVFQTAGEIRKKYNLGCKAIRGNVNICGEISDLLTFY